MDRYVHLIRADDDPERSPREKRRGQETKWNSGWSRNNQEMWEEGILNHLSDDIPRTFNRIMVEIADANADTAFEKAPDWALWKLVETYHLEFVNKAPLLFRRPPGWKKHYRRSKHTSIGACGRSTTLFKTGESVHDDWDEVTCLACQQLRPQIERCEALAKEDEMGMKHRNIEAAKRVAAKADTKAAKKKEEVKDPVNPILAEGARRMFANALIAARKNGEKIVQGYCTHCGEKKGNQKTCCLLCALVAQQEALGGAADEKQIAEFLMVPDRWLLDLISGFDKDGDSVTYRFAKRIGAGLWRKYGSGPKKARA
jgi:hypothetical protein